MPGSQEVVWFGDLKDPISEEEVGFYFFRSANEGFLLADTLPFAMRYSTALRKTTGYLRLLSATRQYFLSKLGDSRIPWSGDTRVAIAFRWHGLRVIEAYREGIRLPSGQLIAFHESQIASDDSGYTNSELLKKIWKLGDDVIRT